MSTPNLDTSPLAPDATPHPLRLTRHDWIAVALLVASLVGMFWKVVFTSAMFFYRDVYNYTFPSARFIHDLCRQGFLPYWNPYLNYGQPVLANPNLLFFYPFTLLIVLLPVDIAFTMHFLVHFALAGIGVYVLARSWGQTYLGAFFAAIVFMLSGPVLSLGDLYNESACAAWIPWALLVTDRALESTRLRLWILLVVIFSFQWLAGEPLTMLATFGLCFSYAFYRCGAWGKLWSKSNFRLLAIFFLVGAGMMLLCAAQFLPASNLLSQSRRGVQGLRFRETANWAVNPFSLPEMIVPDFFGSGMAAPTGWLWLMSDSNLPYFLSVFLGFVPIFCAMAGWALGRDRRRDFVAGATGVFLLLSFGHFTPVFALAYLLFPPLTVLRYELPGLAGFCLGGIVLAYGLEMGKPWARPGLYAFAVLAIGQLVAVNSGANPTAPKAFFTYRPPVLKEFKDPPGTYRVASFWPIVQTPDTKNLQTYINFESIPEAADFGPMAQGAFQARLQLATGSMLNQVEGSINLDLERSLPPYLYDIEIYQDRQATDPLRVDCLLGRTNVKYIIRPTPADSAATHALGDVFNGSPLPSRLYEDLCFVPRTYVAGNSLFSTNSAETLDQLASPDFDALNSVILAAAAGSSPNIEPAFRPARGEAGLMPGATTAVNGGAPAGQVKIVHRDPNSVTLRAQLARPAYVVLLDRYDPNWQATLDGRPAPVLRANQIFRAVYAGAGLHEIRFDYRQRGFRLGLIISIVTLAVLVALYFHDP